MSKIFLSISLLVVLIMATSCRKTLRQIDQEGEVSFLVRLPSLAQARFEARCISEDIFLYQVKIQSPSATLQTIDFFNQRIAMNEIFTFGSLDSEDGTWLITFIGTDAIANKSFQKTYPYVMSIEGDDNK